MDEIICCLKQYKVITLELIKLLESEDYDSLESLLDSRQKLIDEMDKMNCTKETKNKIYEELQIQELQDKLNVVMNEKQEELKVNIANLSTGKIARKGYTNGFKADSFFINKKI